MGAPCALRLYGGSEVEAAAEAAIADVRRLEAKYSRYQSDSLASTINRSAGDRNGIEVDEETAALLDHARTAYESSDGRVSLKLQQSEQRGDRRARTRDYTVALLKRGTKNEWQITAIE